MIGLRARTCLALLAVACGDDAPAETESGFTTGMDSTGSPSTTMTTSPSTSTTPSTSDGPTTDEPTDSSSSTTMALTVTESSTTEDPTTTTDATTTTTEPTTTTDPSTSTGPVGECGDDVIDGLVCFGDATDVAVGTTPSDVEVGDFDDDGNFDVATANTGTDDVSVLLGDGAGGLGALLTATIAGVDPVQIEVADLNADGLDDLVTANFETDDVSVLLAAGLGGFATSVELIVGDGPSDLDLPDLDGVMGPDLVVANSIADNYISAVNDGLGTFTIDAGAPWTTGAINNPMGIVVGPINGFPIDSWFCAGAGYGAVQGDGDGSFNVMMPVLGMEGSSLGRADRGDVNIDGDMDVVAVDATDDVAYFFLGGAMAAFAATDLDAGADPAEGAIADVTGEGDQDVIVVSGADATVTVFAGDGAGGFDEGVTFTVGNGSTGVAVADLDGDGVGDIVVSNGSDDTVSVLLSDP